MPRVSPQQLQAAGIKANVLVAPAIPDAVDTWVDVRAPRTIRPGQDPPIDPSVHDSFDAKAEKRLEAERLRAVQVHGDVVRIPADYEHDLMLVAGVAPRPGQKPVYDADGQTPLPPGGTAVAETSNRAFAGSRWVPEGQSASSQDRRRGRATTVTLC